MLHQFDAAEGARTQRPQLHTIIPFKQQFNIHIRPYASHLLLYVTRSRTRPIPVLNPIFTYLCISLCLPLISAHGMVLTMVRSFHSYTTAGGAASSAFVGSAPVALDPLFRPPKLPLPLFRLPAPFTDPCFGLRPSRRFT